MPTRLITLLLLLAHLGAGCNCAPRVTQPAEDSTTSGERQSAVELHHADDWWAKHPIGHAAVGTTLAAGAVTVVVIAAVVGCALVIALAIANAHL